MSYGAAKAEGGQVLSEGIEALPVSSRRTGVIAAGFGLALLLGTAAVGKTVPFSAPTHGELDTTVPSWGTGSTYPWFMYKVTVPVSSGMGNMTVDFFSKFLAPYGGSNDLGCSAHKFYSSALNQQIHFVDTPLLERGDMTVTNWIKYFTNLNGDLTNFNVFMHNKVQLFTPDLKAFQLGLDAEEVPYMRRLSTLEDGTPMAHLGVPVEGRIYELVGPTVSLDSTEGFVNWDSDECAPAHQLTLYQNLSSWIAAYESVASSANGVPRHFKGGGVEKKMTPMLVGVSMASDYNHFNADQEDVADIQTFTMPYQTVGEYAGCSVRELTWPTSLSYMVPVRYVHNAKARHGKRTLTEYLDYINGQHKNYTAQTIETWGDNWDHWLDQHIGIQTSDCDTFNSELVTTLVNHSQPVGYRYGSGNDDEVSYHYYTGYRSVFAWEYYITDCTVSSEASTPPELCACTATNNEYIYLAEAHMTVCAN